MADWYARYVGKPCPEACSRVVVDVFDSIYSLNTSKMRMLQAMAKDLQAKGCIKLEFFKENSLYLDLFLSQQEKSMVKGQRTQTYYKQETFNLFLEDSEGFAKLITYLGEIVSQNLQIPFDRFMYKLETIIGRFGLNTDRVLDCILHALEMDTTNELLLQYLRKVPKNSVTQILGFKFRGFLLPDTTSTPQSLYFLAIALYNKDLIDLNLLLPHLSPSVEKTLANRYAVEKEERAAAHNLLKHNLNESEADRKARQIQEQKAVAKRKRNRLEETPNHQLFELLNACLQPE